MQIHQSTVYSGYNYFEGINFMFVVFADQALTANFIPMNLILLFREIYSRYTVGNFPGNLFNQLKQGDFKFRLTSFPALHCMCSATPCPLFVEVSFPTKYNN